MNYSIISIDSSNPPIIKVLDIKISIPLVGEIEILYGEEISKIANMSKYFIIL
jgi:hypothetical protein